MEYQQSDYNTNEFLQQKTKINNTGIGMGSIKFGLRP